MLRGIRKQIKVALSNVNGEIAAISRRGFYAAGLASEGYAGGYRQALYDVTSALDGVPSYHSRYWPPPKENEIEEE